MGCYSSVHLVTDDMESVYKVLMRDILTSLV